MPISYQTGGTLAPTSQLYITRQADNELLELCRDGKFAYILAPRQLGKSSLMVRTAQRLEEEEDTRVVKIDLAGIGKDDVKAEQWYYGLLREIKSQLNLQFNLREWWSQNKDLSVIRRFTIFFEEILLEEVTTRVVIFIDEIDTTLGMTFTDDFFVAIRSLYVARARQRELERLSFVLIGVATPSELIRDVTRTPFNIGQRVEMTDFSLEEALPLAKGLPLPVKEARQLLNWILDWTGGHPYLTQRLCQAVASQGEVVCSWKRAELSQLVRETFFGEKSVQDNNLQFVRDMISRRTPDLVGVLSTYREIWYGRHPVMDEEHSIIKTHLKLSGVVRRDNGKLKVRNAIYRQVFNPKWIKEHLPINWGRQIKRYRGLIAISLAVTFLMSLLTLYAVSQQSLANVRATEAEQERGQAVAARSTSEAKSQEIEKARIQSERARKAAEVQTLVLKSQGISDPEVGLLLNIEALSRLRQEGLEDLNNQAENSLRRAVQTYIPQRVLRGHTAGVAGVAFSPDAQSVATAGVDGTIRLWDVTNGKQLKVLSSTTNNLPLLTLSFSHNGKTIYSEDTKGIVHFWNIDSGLEVRSLDGCNCEADPLLSPDGTFAFTVNVNRTTAQLINLETGREVTLSTDKTFTRLVLSGPNSVYWVSFNTSPDAQLASLAFSDGTVQLFNAVTGQRIYELVGHKQLVSTLEFSPDSKQLVTAGNETVAYVWDLTTGKLKATLTGHSAFIAAAAFSPDGKLIVTTSGDSTARVWDAQDGRLLATLKGHTTLVDDAIFSPDGQYIITAGYDSTVRLWSVTNWRELLVLKGHTDYVSNLGYNHRGLKFSPDGRFLATASNDGTARLWEWETVLGQSILLDKHSAAVQSIAFSPDQKLVATAGRDNTIRVWETKTGRELVTIAGHLAPVMSVTFTQDSKSVISASNDGTVRKWDALSGLEIEFMGPNILDTAAISPDGNYALTVSNNQTSYVWEFGQNGNQQPLTILTGHSGPINSASFSPDSKFIVTASTDKTVRVWEATTGKELTVLMGHQSAVCSAVFSSNGKYILSAGDDGTVRIWEATSGKQVKILTGHSGAVNQASFSPDDKLVVSAGKDGTARVWDSSSGKELVVFKGHGDSINSASFSSDSRRVVSASKDGTTRIWDSSTGEELTLLQNTTKASVNSASFSPDGTRLVTGGDDGQPIIWDSVSGKAVSTLPKLSARIRQVAFTQKGNSILIISEDNQLRELDSVSGELKRYLGLGVSEEAISGLALSSDNKLLATGSYTGKIHVWDVSEGLSQAKEAAVLNGWYMLSPQAFSGDGKRLAMSGSGNNAQVWDSVTKKRVSILQGHTGTVQTAVLNRAGSIAVTGSDDGTVRVWEANTGKELLVLRGHTGPVSKVSFNPDDTLIVSAGADGVAIIWEVSTGKEFAIFKGHSDEINQVTFSPDGKFIGTASKDKTAAIYYCAVCNTRIDLLTVAQSLVYRSLTDEEKSKYGLKSTSDSSNKDLTSQPGVGSTTRK